MILLAIGAEHARHILVFVDNGQGGVDRRHFIIGPEEIIGFQDPSFAVRII